MLTAALCFSRSLSTFGQHLSSSDVLTYEVWHLDSFSTTALGLPETFAYKTEVPKYLRIFSLHSQSPMTDCCQSRKAHLCCLESNQILRHKLYRRVLLHDCAEDGTLPNITCVLGVFLSWPDLLLPYVFISGRKFFISTCTRILT